MRFWGRGWGRCLGFSGFEVDGAHGRAPQAERLNTIALPRFREMVAGDFAVGDGDTFLFEHLFLFRETTGVTRESAVGADDAVAGNGGCIRVLIQGVADGAIAFGVELAGDVGVAEDLALGDAGGQGPDFLVEGHLRRDLAGVNRSFNFSHSWIVAR